MLMATQQPIIDEIRDTYRMRTDFHSAEKRLTQQAKAICRRLTGEGPRKSPEADKLYTAVCGKGEHPKAEMAMGYLMPILTARGHVEVERKRAEKALEKLAKRLSVWPWVESVSGMSALTLGQIIGETGDLSNYPNPAKLWKRMGLAVINGERQRKVVGADALDHGYSPTRRSIVWNLGECIVKAQIRRDEDGESTASGFYGRLYLERRAYERDRLESLAHANNRAKRYMTKRLLRDLWRVWRDE